MHHDAGVVMIFKSILHIRHNGPAKQLPSSVFITWFKDESFLSTVNRLRASVSNTRSLELIRCDTIKSGLYKIWKTHKTFRRQDGFEPPNPTQERQKNVLILIFPLLYRVYTKEWRGFKS